MVNLPFNCLPEILPYLIANIAPMNESEDNNKLFDIKSQAILDLCWFRHSVDNNSYTGSWQIIITDSRQICVETQPSQLEIMLALKFGLV